LGHCINDFGELQEFVFSQGHAKKPSELDYKLVFVWHIIVAIATTPDSVFFKPFPDYFEPYYSIVDTLLEGVKSLEPYQMKLFSHISGGKEREIIHLRMVKVYINMIYLPNNVPFQKQLIASLQQEKFYIKPNKDKLMWCTHVITKYDLQGSFDLMKVCTTLLDFNRVGCLTTLIKDNVPLQRKVIETVVKAKHMTQNLRMAETLCDSWKLGVEEFGELRRIKCQNSVNRFFAKMNENVDKTIELLDGEKEFMDMFSLILRKKGRK